VSNTQAGKVLKAADKDILGTSFDMVCFGHVIFEMALGYELTMARPNVEQLVGKCEYALIEYVPCQTSIDVSSFNCITHIRNDRNYRQRHLGGWSTG
jgi:hypothetical protein